MPSDELPDCEKSVERGESNELASSGLMLAILAYLPCLYAPFACFGLPLVTGGFIVSLLGLRRAKRTNVGRRAAIAGMVLPVVWVILVLIWYVVSMVAFRASIEPWAQELWKKAASEGQ